MISSLVMISIVSVALVGWLCTLMYKKQEETLKQIKQQQIMLANLDLSFKELSEKQISTSARIGQLSADLLQRDVFQNTDNRHQLAIKGAKQGKSLFELTRRHGLSSDEAALILSLHSPENAENEESTIKNANLVQPSDVGLV